MLDKIIMTISDAYNTGAGGTDADPVDFTLESADPVYYDFRIRFQIPLRANLPDGLDLSIEDMAVSRQLLCANCLVGETRAVINIDRPGLYPINGSLAIKQTIHGLLGLLGDRLRRQGRHEVAP